VVDRGGVESVLRLGLDESEIGKLRQSAGVLRETIQSLHLA
jgi:malate/lactate dehydrogenase